jgi:hypothetical protein
LDLSIIFYRYTPYYVVVGGYLYTISAIPYLPYLETDLVSTTPP